MQYCNKKCKMLSKQQTLGHKRLKAVINQRKAAFHSHDTSNLKIINVQLKKAIDLKTVIGYKKKFNLPNVENNENFL